jgi:hypothetical protein
VCLLGVVKRLHRKQPCFRQYCARSVLILSFHLGRSGLCLPKLSCLFLTFPTRVTTSYIVFLFYSAPTTKFLVLYCSSLASSILPLPPNTYGLYVLKHTRTFGARKPELEVRNFFYSYCVNRKFKCLCNTFTKTAPPYLSSHQYGGADRDNVVGVAIRCKLDGVGIESR